MRLLTEMSEELELERKKVSDLEEVEADLRENIEKHLYGEEVRFSKTLAESGERSARCKIKTLAKQWDKAQS